MSVSYTHKLHAFKPSKTWSVEKDGLRWEDQDEAAKSGFMAFEDITSVRLRFEPSRAETRRVALHVYNPIDHPITNIDYQGPLSFHLQKPEFQAFVGAFHAGFPPGAKTVFHKGSTMGAYIGNLIITAGIGVFLLFLAPLISLTGMPGGTSILRIVIILILIPVLIKMLRKNKPETYRPENWPQHMLE